MKNLFDINGKVIVITGGCGILGRGIALYLAEQGAKIVILDRAAEVGEQIVADIKAKGGEASFFLTDVLNKEILEQNKKDILALVTLINEVLERLAGVLGEISKNSDLCLIVDEFLKHLAGKAAAQNKEIFGDRFLVYRNQIGSRFIHCRHDQVERGLGIGDNLFLPCDNRYRFVF